jgi:hypothetical protein
MIRSLRRLAFALAALMLAAPAVAAPSDEMLVVSIELPAAEAGQLHAELEQWLDVWSHHPEPGAGPDERTVVARVTPAQLAAVRESGLGVTVDRARTERLRTLEHARRVRDKSGDTTAKTIPGFGCYRTVEETYAAQDQLASRYPRLARVVDFGDSWDKGTAGGPGGYDLRALVLTNRDSPHAKAPFVVEATIHAREYTPAELALRWAERLLAGHGPGRDADATWLLDHTEIHVITPLNPDGRKRAEEGILWRKNVDNRFCSDSQFRGVDLNRNSPYFWGGGGTSSDPCSEVFPGDGPASEPETQALHAYLATVFDDQRGPDLGAAAPLDAAGAYLSLHSYGRFIVGPDWNGQGRVPPNQAGIAALMRNVAAINGFDFIPDPRATTGMTIDTAYGDHGVPAMLVELGTDFFESCGVFENEILPRNLPALTYYAKTASRPYRLTGPRPTQVAVSSRSVLRGQPVELTALVEDLAGGGVRSAAFTVDELPVDALFTLPMAPTDGVWNGRQERVRSVVDTWALDPGWHQVYVIGFDGGFTQGVPTAVWIEVRGTGPVVHKPFALPLPGEGIDELDLTSGRRP